MTLFAPARGLHAWIAAAILITHIAAAAAEGLPTFKPEEVGVSSSRLDRIGDWLRTEVQQRNVPGAVVMVVRGGGQVYFEAVGQRDPADPALMRRDDIFRIHSLTKPIVSVAAMMLVEEGRLVLNAPVSRYIPAFEDVKVGVEKADASGTKALELVLPRKPMTVHDLLRHTSGLTYGIFGDTLVNKAYRDARLLEDDLTNAEFVERLATLPLAYQPGTTFEYGHSTDVLGRIIEVVSGQPLLALLKQRLLDPLGMKDTSFYVTDPVRQRRIAEPWPDDRKVGIGREMTDPRVARKWESGGGGLLSTAPDYARFLMMLRNGGELDGKRYLSSRTVQYMTSDHLGTAIARANYTLPGYSFGLGFAVRTSAGEASSVGTVGDYFWGGAGGPSILVDPTSDLFAVLMMQSPKQRGLYRSTLRGIVYGALTQAQWPPPSGRH